MNPDLSAPQVTLEVSQKGKPWLPIDRDRIMAAHFEEKHRGSSELTFDLDNSDGAMWYVEPLLVKGSSIKFSFGYPNKMRGPITFKNSGKPSGAHTLQVKALVKSHRKGSDEWVRTRSWENMAFTEVVEKVAAEMGFTSNEVDVDFDFEKHEFVSQRNETDLQFLYRLADISDRIFWIDESGFHFKIPAADTKPSVSFRMVTKPLNAGDIIDYSLPKTPQRIPRKIKLLGRDPLKRTTVSTTIDMEDKELPNLCDNPIVDDDAAVYVARTFSPTNAAAAAEARRLMRETKLKAVKMELQIFGEPFARPGVVSLVRRLADPLNGKWYIWKAEHSIEGGDYETKLLLGREGFSKKKSRRSTKDQTDPIGELFTAVGRTWRSLTSVGGSK